MCGGGAAADAGKTSGVLGNLAVVWPREVEEENQECCIAEGLPWLVHEVLCVCNRGGGA